MAKPPPTPEQLAARAVEPDPVPPIEGSTSNEGYAVPASPPDSAPQLAHVNKVLSQVDATALLDIPPDVAERQAVAQAARSPLEGVRPVTRNFANEAYVDEMIDGQGVVDLMTGNVAGMAMIEPIDPDTFREFENQAQYEAFMAEPVVIRVHSTRDKNEPTKVFVGVNGDNRWLNRDLNYRVPRKFVERLAQAQERTYETKDNPDPTVDNAIKLLQRNAVSYSFSVLHDPNPHGRRWLNRMTRSGS